MLHRPYSQVRHDRFAGFLTAWLQSLPAAGWAGTPTELHSALCIALGANPAYCHGVWIPAGRGLYRRLIDHAPTIAAAGFRVEFTRTKKARAVRFTRTPLE